MIILDDNLSTKGVYVDFIDASDSFIGLEVESNPFVTRGNVTIGVSGPVDSLILHYHYGRISNGDILGTQLIGLSDIYFTSGDVCKPPRIIIDSECADMNGAVDIFPLSNDESGSFDLDPTTLTIVSPPSNGVAIINSDGSINYIPDNDFQGVDVITYQVCDEMGNCEQGEIGLTVIHDNTIRIQDDQFSMFEGTEISGNTLSNDTDPEGDDLLGLSVLVKNPSNGQIVYSASGAFTYIPNDGFVGIDSFAYHVCDNNSVVLCDQAWVYINVLPIVHPDVSQCAATNDYYVLMANEGFDGSVLSNDLRENDLSNSVISLIMPPSNGIVELQADGNFE